MVEKELVEVHKLGVVVGAEVGVVVVEVELVM